VTDALLHDTKEATLMHRWRYPTLSLHGIEGAFDGAGSKTVIPRKVVGKFSMRIVPNLTPVTVEAAVRAHVESVWASLRSPNNMTLALDKASFPWHREPSTAEFAAAARATVRVHGAEPALTREGGSIPIVGVFEEECEACCVLLPIGGSDDGAHSQNEKLDRANYLNGIKVL
jgi:nonspecific dipeptidase